MRLVTTLLLTAALSMPAWTESPANDIVLDQDGNPYLPGVTVPIPDRGVAPRSGGPMIFNDQAAFLAAAGAVTTETFEDEPWTAGCTGGALPMIAVDDFMATSSPDAMKILRDACAGNHNTTPGGLRYLGADTDLGGISADVMFVFDQPITALGLYLVDLDTAVLEVGINGMAYPVGPNGDGGESYFGIVGAAPFTSVTFRIVTEFDSHYSFDDVAYLFGGPVSVDARSWGRTKADYRE